MLFGSFGKSVSMPIAVDFGVASLKILQLHQTEPGKPPSIQAAAARPTPPELMDQPVARLEHQSRMVTEMLKVGGFKGRRTVCSIPSMHIFVQHLQLPKTDARSIDATLADELRRVTGREPTQFILRHLEVGEIHRGGQKKTEVICFAMPREAVLAHMQALRACKLDVVGVHSEHLALVRSLASFSEQSAAGTTIAIDLGHGTTKVVVAHGSDLKLAKALTIAGRQLCTPAAAPEPTDAKAGSRSGLRAQLAALENADTATMTAVLEAPNGTTVTAAPPAQGELSPAAVDALADEIAQAVRYHQALFPDRKIDRAVFFGGEARRLDLCKKIARALGMPAQVADPLAVLAKAADSRFDGVDHAAPAPGWAVALGLANMPTDA